MSDPPTTAEERYATIVEALLNDADVSLGSPDDSQSKQGFGSAALRIRNKIFAMLSSKGRFVVKLPRQRVDALIAAGEGERFNPGHGRLMKEWVAIEPSAAEAWLSLAREAMQFVGSKTVRGLPGSPHGVGPA
ncbi:MAG: hypothetical protein ACR2PL_26170 [Dehalococcoidia bacterium]